MKKMTSQDTIVTVTVKNILELEGILEAEKHVNLDFSFVRTQLGPKQGSKYTPQIIATTKKQIIIYDGVDEEDPNFGYCKLRTLNKVLGITEKMNGRVNFTIDGKPYRKARKDIKIHIQALYDRMHAERNYGSDA